MNLTLFVDASFDQKTRAAGWGAWAIRDDWDRGLQMSGPVAYRNGRPETSNAAELAGIGLALWSYMREGHLDGVSRFMIQCDNTVALSILFKNIPGTRIIKTSNVFIGRTSFKDHKTDEVVATIKDILNNRPLSIKHVKGHSSGKGGRFWVNGACDAAARKHMIEMRKKINDKGGCRAD